MLRKMRLGCKNLLHDTPDLIKILGANENAQKLKMNKEKIKEQILNNLLFVYLVRLPLFGALFIRD